jgi:hypothetical protein
MMLKLQNPSSILAQTHTCDFQRFHINLFFKLIFLLKRFWEKWNGATYNWVSFQLEPSLNILSCEKNSEYILRKIIIKKKKPHYVSKEIKHEKDASCIKYCYFGEISCCCHELGFLTLACLHSQVAKKFTSFKHYNYSNFMDEF